MTARIRSDERAFTLVELLVVVIDNPNGSSAPPQSGRGRAHPGPSHTTGHAGPHPAVRVASRKRR